MPRFKRVCRTILEIRGDSAAFCAAPEAKPLSCPNGAFLYHNRNAHTKMITDSNFPDPFRFNRCEIGQLRSPGNKILDELQSTFSEFMRQVEFGDAVAEQRLWNELYQRVLRHVETRIRCRGIPTGLVDEDAITASAMESVFKCAKEGKLTNLQDWSELSRLLLAMTNRKFIDHWRRAKSQKAAPLLPILALPANGFELPDRKVVTCFIAFEEQLSRLMNLLSDKLDRRIAELKLAERTLTEISEDIGKSIATINRKWRVIRRIWADELERSV